MSCGKSCLNEDMHHSDFLFKLVPMDDCFVPETVPNVEIGWGATASQVSPKRTELPRNPKETHQLFTTNTSRNLT